MAEIVSQGQAVTNQRHRLIEFLVVALAAAAVVIAIAWAAFAASTPQVATPTRTSIEYLQEPGMLDQRQGELGVNSVAVPGGTLLDPAMQEHRRGEREGS
jgi:hypothetical protein